jgi:hypothetical protein
LVSSANSSSTPLGSSATFTGTSEDVTDFTIAYVTVFADQDSAADGLVIERSSDGTNWDLSDEFSILASQGRTFSVQCDAQFFRVRFTNGSTGQSAFRLQTVFKQVYGKPSTHRIQDQISNEDDSELVKAIITGLDPNDSFRNIAATTTGALKVAVSAAPADLGNLIVDDLKTGGGAVNMNVDGSVTPVNFEFLADGTDDIFLNELRFVFLPNVLRVDDSSFGSISALTNGVRVAVTSGGVETVLALWKKTSDLFLTSSGSTPLLETNLSSNDLVVFGIDFGGAVKLVGGSSDKVQVRVQDDLTGAGPNNIIVFRGKLQGIKQS